MFFFDTSGQRFISPWSDYDHNNKLELTTESLYTTNPKKRRQKVRRKRHTLEKAQSFTFHRMKFIRTDVAVIQKISNQYRYQITKTKTKQFEM